MPPASYKKFIDYIIEDEDASNILENYAESPSTAFLTQAVHLCNSIDYCKNNFRRKQSGSFNRDSQDAIYSISASLHASVMSHFETWQRMLFSGLIEVSRFPPTFDVEKCMRKLGKDNGLTIDLVRLASFRGQPAPIGQLIHDSLRGWHDPEKVNKYFGAVLHTTQFYSEREIEQLRILWQLRHSVVHTAGWLTQPDAQKVPDLKDLGEQPILLDYQFVPAVVRRLHHIIKRSVESLEEKFREQLTNDLNQEEQDEIDALFKVESPRSSYFR